MEFWFRWPALVIAALCAAAAAAAHSAPTCSLRSGEAGFIADYTSASDRQQYLYLVEIGHFTDSVRNLKRGSSGYPVAPDISYTLDHFPNHHQALDAASRLSIMMKTPQPRGLRCSVEGWFVRAMEFKPDDAVVRMTYGIHFYREKKLDKAVEQFEQAEKLAPENINLAYNLGLVYYDLKDYAKAMAYADRAYSADFPLDGLKKKLMKAGKWVEPRRAESRPEKSRNEPSTVAEPAPAESKQ